MPILENPKHELFAQALAKGETATKAYELAGFKPSRHNAARLKSFQHIGERVAEIQAAGASSAKVTIESLLNELEHARQRADSLGQLSASVKAISTKARVSGLLVERQQIEVTEPEFPDWMTVHAILDRVAERVSVEKAKLLAECFEVHDWPASPTIDVTPRNAGNGNAVKLPAEWRPPISNGRKREIS